MGLTDWIQRSYARIDEDGRAGATDSLDDLYSGMWRYLGWHVPRGTNIYEREWDTLVILDACRVDLLREVADEYSFLGPVGSFESVGSMSEEWMEKTFTEEYAEETRQTAYVTSNIFSERVLSTDQFLELDEVWRYAWDNTLGIVPPRPVTDRAITVARDQQPDRMIVHYMQPHHPFISDDVSEHFAADPFGRENETTVVDALRRGEISRDAFWDAYRENLRLVLNDVAVLLENHDAEKVIITADHGDALGEWGIYDHPAGCLHPVVKNVPWSVTTATDENEYEPQLIQNKHEANVEERLRGLGYL
ncbi:hypothetical protein [Halobacteriaceae bacterium SHR40]|uniref:hypothetical protein n=1 Tax=Halovenus amylolytica TaxID=2500550 RepID=UPI000FE404C8